MTLHEMDPDMFDSHLVRVGRLILCNNDTNMNDQEVRMLLADRIARKEISRLFLLTTLLIERIIWSGIETEDASLFASALYLTHITDVYGREFTLVSGMTIRQFELIRRAMNTIIRSLNEIN